MDIIKRIRKKLKKDSLSEMIDEIKWMYVYVKRYWFAIVFYSVMGVLGTIMGLIGSVLTKNLIDVVTGYRTGEIIGIAAFMLAMGTGNIVMNSISSRISAYLSIKVQNEIQADVYDRIMEAEWEELHDFRSGDLLNRLSIDVSNVSNSVIGWIPSLLTKTVQFAGALGIILYYDPTMAAIALMSAPVSLIVSNFLLGKMRKYNKELRKVSSELMSFQEDSFQNLQSIKSFGIVENFETGMRDTQEKYKTLMMDYNKMSIFATGFMSFSGMLVSYVSLGWGVYRLWSGDIIFGTLTLFLQLSSNLSSSFSGLISLVPQAISAMTCAGRVMSVFELPKEKSVTKELADKMKENGKEDGLEVVINNLGFSYKDGNEVLKDIEFAASPGSIVALIGPSGEGKTTFIRILLGLINPTRGNAYLKDINGELCEISNATRTAFSYVPQGNTIFAGTIEENLRMVKPDATTEEIKEALKAACALDFVEKMPEGIKSEIRERGKGLSEGQAQRISIARAILRDAPIILLDEATSALDVVTERKVLENILKYNSKKTCIVTTHRPSVLHMCQSVYRIDRTILTKLSEEEAASIAMDY